MSGNDVELSSDGLPSYLEYAKGGALARDSGNPGPIISDYAEYAVGGSLHGISGGQTVAEEMRAERVREEQRKNRP